MALQSHQAPEEAQINTKISKVHWKAEGMHPGLRSLRLVVCLDDLVFRSE